MVFMVVVPLIPSTLGYFLLPLQLGARNLALPTLSRCSFRWYALGSILVLATLAIYPVGTGWTFNNPYTLIDGGSFALMAFGLFFIAASWVATGVNFLVTVHSKRAPGMGFFDMPILSWSLYLTGYVLTVAGLIFAVIILYLASANAFGKGLFSGGGNPLDWQNYFWFVTTPLAFFAVIPAVGVITEVIAGVSRKAVAGYRTLVTALIMLLAVSFTSWGVHMIGSGQDAMTTFTFSVLSLFAVVPVALITYSWLATLHRGSITCAAPTTYIMAFLLNAGIGTVLGLFLSNLSVGSYLASTVFTTAYIHYLLMGGIVTALLAGLHYWWPKMTGTSYNQIWGRLGAVLFTLGLNLAFFPQIILGTKGTAPALPEIPAEMLGLQQISTIGVVVMVFGLSAAGWNLIAAFLHRGTGVENNPWGASTLEWRTSSPPAEGNFDNLPDAQGPYVF